MKRLALLALLIPLLLPAPTMAQSARTPVTTATTRATTPPHLAKPKPATRSCPEFGAGFVRLEGSDTCVRIGGYLDIGTTTRGGR